MKEWNKGSQHEAALSHFNWCLHLGFNKYSYTDLKYNNSNK